MKEVIESILEKSCIVIHDDVEERLIQVVLDECVKIRAKQKDKDMMNFILALNELGVGKEDICYFLKRYYLLDEEYAYNIINQVTHIRNHIAHIGE